MENSEKQIFKIDRRIISSRTFGIFNIELTNRCPMKCVMCPRTSHMTREQGFMELELFKKISDELAEVNRSYSDNQILWLHHFGESLLHPEFENFIRYAAGKGINTGLSVNPFMLDEKTSISLLNSGLHTLYLSLDGHDDESFYKIRGVKNMYDTSLDRMINFLRLKKENRSSINIILSMIDFPLNDESINSVKEKWESHDEIDSFIMKNYTAWDGAVPEINSMAPAGSESGKYDYLQTSCSFPWTHMTVTWDGDVVPCCFDYNKKMVIGNAWADSLGYIWNDLPMQKLRNEFISNDVKNPLCRNCGNLHLVQEIPGG